MNQQFKVGILTISDSGSSGTRKDVSGQILEKIAVSNNLKIQLQEIIPDDFDKIQETLIEWSDNGEVDLILSTGGTGLGPRDRTPEATKLILDIEVPGISEIMRIQTFSQTPFAVLSRSVSGVRSGCLIVNLPGSPSGVEQCMNIILPSINHALEMIRGWKTH
ncbi:MAG: molybdenum cofactor biosynthesis protein [Chloroflexi bacterium]|nr:molybdenum cofactor biosynthesis protein [Chloroflexota bacterium]|tara:strand:- start:9209 stop:9697 length:489 start_codon:yes stop_codon:yes gene_type:complete